MKKRQEKQSIPDNLQWKNNKKLTRSPQKIETNKQTKKQSKENLW